MFKVSEPPTYFVNLRAKHERKNAIPTPTTGVTSQDKIISRGNIQLIGMLRLIAEPTAAPRATWDRLMGKL